MKVLLLEDAPKMARFLAQGFAEEGYEVVVSGDIHQAKIALSNSPVDVIVLDRMLPDGDGLDLVRELRRSGDSTPAICLTARDRPEERVEGLRSGADDYLIKPFSFQELLARIDLILKRALRGDKITIGRLTLNPKDRTAYIGNNLLKLTKREYDLLLALAHHTGEVMTRTRLIEEVWGQTSDIQSNAVDVHITYLRNKIGAKMIRTVRGVGYLLESTEQVAQTEE
ncbi:MAG: response regulator transcription factor [Gammaproteobacteria bacterium]|nr:response regulator transcription factor [Gammaproteobacteria bacterium]